MRSNTRAGRGAAAITDASAGRPGMLHALGWSHRDAVGFGVGAFAIIAILINMLFLQPGPHPAPIVRSGVVSAAPGPVLAGHGTGTVLPKPRAINLAPVKSDQTKSLSVPTPAAPAVAVRPAVDVTADIQRELSRRGFYDGTVDGRYGPKTDAAIRDFEQAAGLRPSGQPNEDLLRAIAGSPIKARPQAPAARKQSTAVPPAHPDPIGDMLSPSNRVMAVQRALTEFGYGQINPTGIIDPDTQGAIERFERERRLPLTGQLSHRVVRELASITGRPLE